MLSFWNALFLELNSVLRPRRVIFICVHCAVYSMSLRQQLQDPGKKPVMSQHFINKDKDGTANRHVCFL